MMVTKETFEKCCNVRGFVWIKINDHFYICHLYGNKEMHPIGYYIPIIVKIKKSA